ncbi:MAG: Glu/Leu/Phe/Val dehydrogenase dimerization domain-containing protein [Nannocystaceae bacterium]
MQLIPVQGFAQVLRLDCAGATAFLAIHATIDGRAFGGIRIRDYADDEAALADALALARAMSRKAVLAGIRGGGAKTVLVCPAPSRRRAALVALAEQIESLGGRYLAGGDYGFTKEDDAVVRERTRYLASGDLDDATAAGVEAAMCARAAPERVAIQGLGRVGARLAQRLCERGVEVLAADPRPPARLPAAVELVAPAAIAACEADVFAPCAHGGLLDAATIDRLRCRLVCGAANNPLAAEADADRLVRRAIAYVPDFVANAGALIDGASRALGEAALIGARMAALPLLVRELLDRAEAEGRSPHRVAIELADRRLADLRDDAPRTAL